MSKLHERVSKLAGTSIDDEMVPRSSFGTGWVNKKQEQRLPKLIEACEQAEHWLAEHKAAGPDGPYVSPDDILRVLREALK